MSNACFCALSASSKHQASLLVHSVRLDGEEAELDRRAVQIAKRFLADHEMRDASRDAGDIGVALTRFQASSPDGLTEIDLARVLLAEMALRRLARAMMMSGTQPQWRQQALVPLLVDEQATQIIFAAADRMDLRRVAEGAFDKLIGGHIATACAVALKRAKTPGCEALEAGLQATAAEQKAPGLFEQMFGRLLRMAAANHNDTALALAASR